MRSLELLVPPQRSLPSSPSTLAPDAPPDLRRKKQAREVLDVFIAGAQSSSPPRSTASALGVLRDLAGALGDLGARPRGKAIVRFYDDAWELCVERLGAKASLSVYRAGSDPSVTVLDRWVAFDEVVDAARDAIRATTTQGPVQARPLDLEVRAIEELLPARPVDAQDDAPILAAPMPVAIEIDRVAPIAFAAEFALRAGPQAEDASEPSVERADLHALLFRGRVRAEIRGRAVDLGEGHPFLVAERLLHVARQTLDAWERGQPFHVRGDAGGVLVGVRLANDAQLALTLGGASHVRSVTSPLPKSCTASVPSGWMRATPPGVSTLVAREVSARQCTCPVARSRQNVSAAAPTMMRSPQRNVARRSMPGTSARQRGA